MKKKTIADTPFGVALDLKNQALEAARFMVKHPSCTLDDDFFNGIKSNVKMTVSSAFADIYSKVVESDEWESLFTLIDLSDADDSVPTIFTLDDITIDGRFISENMPRSFRNAWVNLTPILGRSSSRDSYNSFLQIKDAPRLAALISRGVLCMSYNDSDAWLNASMSEVVLDAYSFILTSPLRMMFNLDIEQEKLIRTILSLYMAQQLQSPKDVEEIPSLLFRCRWLGTPQEIQTRLEPIAEHRQKLAKDYGLADSNEVTFDMACALIAKFGPDRMSKFTGTNFVRFMSRSSMDRNATIMALYYPPYFVYSILATLHGLKHPIFTALTKFSDMKRGRKPPFLEPTVRKVEGSSREEQLRLVGNPSVTHIDWSKLEKYVFDRVWNEPYSEYRTNTRPRILNRIVEVSSGASDGYGNDIATKQYASAAGVLTGEFEQINLPTSDQYYVYSIELNQFRPIKLNALEWVRLSEYCDGSVVDIQMYSDSGRFLWRGGIYIKQDPSGDHALVAVDAAMFHKCLDVVNPDGSVAKLADPSAVFFSKYIDSDGTADNGIGVKQLDLDAMNRIRIYREDPIPNSAKLAFYNGRLLHGNYLGNLKINGYIEYVIDLDVIADIQIDMSKNPPLYLNNAGKERLLIHVPRNSNRKNYLITYNTCDIYVIPNTVTDDALDRGYTASTSGVLFHMCDRESNYHQLTHNDFSIDKDLLDQVAADAGCAGTDYIVRVLVRTHEKKLGLVRDANYCDLLYTVSHSDEDIVKFLINHEDKLQYNMTFWRAAHLEANSAYAAAMMSRVGSTVKPSEAQTYYRPPIEKKFKAGKKYYTLDVTGEWVEIETTAGSDIPEGVMEMRLETGATANFTPIQLNSSTGTAVTDGALEAKQHTGVTITNPNQCMYCGIKRECTEDGVIKEADAPLINSYRCPKFSHRKMLDYIKIFEYISTGKPVVNFVFDDRSPILPYLRDYPLCLTVNLNRMREDGSDAAEKLAAFVQENRGKRLPFAQIRERYLNCTPEYVAEQLVSAAGLNRG